MSLRSLRYTSLKCMSLYALSQFHTCKVWLRCICKFLCINTVSKTQWLFLWVLSPSALSLPTSHFAFSKEYKPDFSNILWHFRASCMKLLQKWENYISLYLKASGSVCPFLYLSSVISLLWLLSCAVTEKNWVQFCLLMPIWATQG